MIIPDAHAGSPDLAALWKESGSTLVAEMCYQSATKDLPDCYKSSMGLATNRVLSAPAYLLPTVFCRRCLMEKVSSLRKLDKERI